MKGIILAGGKATRLYPTTQVVNKHLLPVYNKPMIYYPLSMLMLAEIREVLIISNPESILTFTQLFGSGNDLGMKFDYKIQEKPNGIAEAFLIGKEFIGNDDVCLILGDNIFYGHDLTTKLKQAKKYVKENWAVVFGYHVPDPQRFGIMTFSSSMSVHLVETIEEKPKKPKSNWAVTGLYFYPNNVIQIAEKLKPSKRGELEITDVNKKYLKQIILQAQILGRGFSWFDTGTHDSLIEAGEFVRIIEKRTGNMIGCIEEIAYVNKWIDKGGLFKVIKDKDNSIYGKHLIKYLIEDFLWEKKYGKL